MAEGGAITAPAPRTYSNPRSPFVSCEELRRGQGHKPLVIVGAGLVGLTLAVDLATRGIPSVVLDDNDTVSVGSRAICFSQRSLEILDRLGVAERLRAKGITWNRGRVFFGEREIFGFDLQPEAGYGWPAFINIQQYYVEQWLVERAVETGLVDLRWRSRVSAVEQRPDCALVRVETPEGGYELGCDWLVACDGARSFVRDALGLSFRGQVFQDRFLIADVWMKADFPTERWFWFDPPFNRGQSALLHRQADDVWRIDLQLGWDADPELEKQPERVIPRLRAMLGPDRPFELEWVSIYTFQCRRLDRFVHGRVLFAGDSAHQVSPFGARGGNGGIQDADNLAWKLALVLQGHASADLLASYDEERVPAADENILHSTRATDFITPKNAAARAYRDAVLELSAGQPFARRWVNSGRLSRPAALAASPLVTPCPDAEPLAPGAPLPDAPILVDGRSDWLLRQVGRGFELLVYGDPEKHGAAVRAAVAAAPLPLRPLFVQPPGGASAGAAVDRDGIIARRCGLTDGACLLLRPDQHVAARWGTVDAAAVRTALLRGLASAREATEAVR